MKRLIALPLMVACLGLGGCYVAETTAVPYYGPSYVYSTGYYGYQPYYYGSRAYVSNYGWWGGRHWRGYHGGYHHYGHGFGHGFGMRHGGFHR